MRLFPMPKNAFAGVWMMFLSVFGANAQSSDESILRTARENGVYVVDLRNSGYRIVFPRVRDSQVNYKADYLFSFIAPSGRSLYGVQRLFDSSGHGPTHDSIVRRPLTGSSLGPEEVVVSPFQNVFAGAVSQNEKYMVVVGRLRDISAETRTNRDGVYLWDRSTKAVRRVASAPDAGLTEDIRSLSVNDKGDLVVYESRGEVLRFAASGSRLTQADQHHGRFPVLMPGGVAYVYWDRGWLMMNDAKGKHELLPVENVVGAIRVSPTGGLVAFGVESGGNSSLRICEIQTRICLDGPNYRDWIPGRETYWMRK